jgi:hypothetical protein
MVPDLLWSLFAAISIASTVLIVVVAVLAVVKIWRQQHQYDRPDDDRSKNTNGLHHR